MKYLNKKFSVFMGTKEYSDKYTEIQWGEPKCPICHNILSLLGMKDKKTGKNQYVCNKCNKRILK